MDPLVDVVWNASNIPGLPEEVEVPDTFDIGVGQVAELNEELASLYGRMGWVVNIVNRLEAALLNVLLNADNEAYPKKHAEMMEWLKDMRSSTYEVLQQIAYLDGVAMPIPQKLLEELNKLLGPPPAVVSALPAVAEDDAPPVAEVAEDDAPPVAEVAEDDAPPVAEDGAAAKEDDAAAAEEAPAVAGEAN